MGKVLTVVGARPQFIKAAALSRVLRKTQQEILVHTGQHFDANMSDVFFEELEIPKPDYNLGIAGGSHANMTAKMLIAIEEVLLQEKPDLLLIYGDTNSTFEQQIDPAYQPFGDGHACEKIVHIIDRHIGIGRMKD